MATYRFKAKAEGGKVINGKLEAMDEQAFYLEMEKRRLYCISFKETGSGKAHGFDGKLSLKELNLFCRELGVMLSAGVPMISVLNTMHRRSSSNKMKSCYLALMEQIEKGSSLADAMKDLKGKFPEILIAMVRVGEQSGSLDTVITDMAGFYSKEHAARSKLQTMMIYPSILVAVTIAVVIAVFTYVLPKFFVLFGGEDLPLITRIFMRFSNFLINDWVVLLLFILFLTVAFILTGKTRTGRYYIDKMKCGIPVFSRLMEKSVIARFANTMGILQGNGVPVLDAIQICAKTLGNAYTIERMMRIREEVEKGIPFSDAMEKEGLFEDMVWSMTATGEETGESTEMFRKLYAYYEQEADIATQKLLAILEPAIMLIIGIIIGLVMMSVLLPIYGIYS